MTVNVPPKLIRIQSVRPDFPASHLIVLAWTYHLFIAPVLLMLGMSAAHGLWVQVPAAGYTTCFLLLLGVRVLKARTTTPGWGR